MRKEPDHCPVLLPFLCKRSAELRLVFMVLIFQSREFLKLNPIGYVPLLVDDDIVVTDSFAILMKRAINYQADLFLAPQIHGAIKRCYARKAARYAIYTNELRFPYFKITALSHV
ncbi:hypothetical protein F0562_020138 [Nyssa sinensis]|uniref:GST N-terminal domain-containing protein n=1 Tax=Nyssa sinensis TaxID=561372 RepID=A0A5J5BRN5_9ASTE|nr:hypothetical protein F0562_020138 [Nyssa sinensis]